MNQARHIQIDKERVKKKRTVHAQGKSSQHEQEINVVI